MIDISNLAADRRSDSVRNHQQALAAELRDAARWVTPQAARYPRGIVVEFWRPRNTSGRGLDRKDALAQMLVDGGDQNEIRAKGASATWPALHVDATAKALARIATRSYGIAFEQSPSGVWTVNCVPCVPGAQLVFACDPCLGVVAAHALIEVFCAKRAHDELMAFRASLGVAPG